MKILAIETATPASSVALGDGGSLAAMSVRVDRQGHVGFLVPAIDFCFEQTGWQRSDIEAVAVDVGPGPFTGIRAGIATAQAFAAGVGAPLVAVSSLTVQALRAATGRRRIWSVVDMRRRQVAVAPIGRFPAASLPMVCRKCSDSKSSEPFSTPRSRIPWLLATGKPCPTRPGVACIGFVADGRGTHRPT